jgi:ADP-ribosylglycohydrolase
VNGYDPADIGKKFVAWYSNGYWGAHHKLFDVGATTRMALARIRDGEDPISAGEVSEESNGNGSLMRIAPASVYFSFRGEDVMYERIKEVSSMTHGHFRSVFSCYIFSKFIAELFKGNDKFDSYKSAISSVNDFAARNRFAQSELKLFEGILSGKIDKAKIATIESSGYVVHTLEASFWCFLTTNSFQDAVLKAVNLGGDTDTTGCVTGAMAGLHYGPQAIPAEWLNVLARKNDITKLSEDFNESLKKQILHGKS